MDRITFPFALLFASACEPQLVTDYRTTVDAMRGLVEEHAQAAGDAATMDDVAALEAPYQDDWEALRADLGDQLMGVGDCYMPRKGHPLMNTEEAEASMDGMDHDMVLHMGDHAGHTDVDECHDEEAAHLESMAGMLDEMVAYADGWARHGMHCP